MNKESGTTVTNQTEVRRDMSADGTGHCTDGTDHNMTAEAVVPLDADLTEQGLEATQPLDLAIRKWVCACGETWGYDETDQAEDHLRSLQADTEQEDSA